MLSVLEKRVFEARRALDAARDARERNHSTETAAAVAIAQQHFDDARRAAARWDVV
ncbi:hypothetical protein ABEV34_06870 [Methylorubrum rhodesianum]|uniref:hypothetical protein n=1 Tax=Methylorubrum TaxID=2282523 RepID=UPI00161549C6|nr:MULTISPECIES: hypothetical protein [Methylorubrum]MBB5765684.1 hypothetical protein [Methylorubrum rhodesianum]